MAFVKKWWTLGIVPQGAKSGGSRPYAEREYAHFFAKSGGKRAISEGPSLKSIAAIPPVCRD